MLALLRIIFGFALFSVLARAVRLAEANPATEGTTDGGYLALAVIIGIANAIVWAPLVGRLMADPLTGAFTTGHPGDYRNHLVQFVNKLGARGWRRTALFFAFLEGIRHPDLPAAFVLGMRYSRPGSLLERIFAREVWRFDNAENCLRAWKVLQEAGTALPVHRRPEVNLLILSTQREQHPEPKALPLPPADPPPPLRRNQRIRLFEGADRSSTAEVGKEGEPVEETALLVAAPVGSSKELALPSPPSSDRVEKAGAEPGTARPLTFSQRVRVLLTGRIDS